MIKHAEIRRLLLSSAYPHETTFTVVNNRSGGRFTFKLAAVHGDDTGTKFFVSVLAGSENTRDFRYLGLLMAPRDRYRARVVYTNSAVGEHAPSAVAFHWLVQRAFHCSAEELPEGAEVLPSSRCGRCGRKLTTPESIRTGIGPVCQEKLG